MTDYTWCSWNDFSTLVPFKSKRGHIFPFITDIPWMKNQGLCAYSPHIQCWEKMLQLEMGANSNLDSLYPGNENSHSDLLWQKNHLERTLYNFNQWVQSTLNFWGRSKELLMKNKVEAKKPQSWEGSHWSSSEVNWGWRGGGGGVETGRSVRKGVLKAGEASFTACYPSCPLARLSSGSASHRCYHHHNFQSTFWLQNSRVCMFVCVLVRAASNFSWKLQQEKLEKKLL